MTPAYESYDLSESGLQEKRRGQTLTEERWAIHVDGIKLPGYDSYEEAQAKINADPDLKSRGAVVVQLVGAPNPCFQTE